MRCHTYVDMMMTLERVSLSLINCLCCSICGRLFERIFAAVLLRDARMCVAAALVLDMPAWYYCAKVQFVYANEFMHGMWRSQVTYTYIHIYVYTCVHM
jgi:hypothetical protein